VISECCKVVNNIPNPIAEVDRLGGLGGSEHLESAETGQAVLNNTAELRKPRIVSQVRKRLG
jgi:hypothetical protein